MEEERIATRQAARVVTVPPAQAASVSVPSQRAPIEVVLVWDGISPLHQSFFIDNEAMTQLGKDLSASVKPPANVYISFDSNRHIGRILLRLLPGTGIDLAGERDDQVELNRISPVLQALARYRSRVASRYDTRVEAFRIGIESFRGTSHCRFGAAGTPPPDGTVVDPCVRINGASRCGEANGALLGFEPSVIETIRACLR